MTDPTSPLLSSVDLYTLLDNVPGIVTVLDAGGTVVWINGFVEELTGYRVEELVGTNMLAHVDLEWNPLALESIGYALDHPGVRLPTMLRFRTKRGEPVVMEATANNQLGNPEINGLVVHLRDSDERQLTDQVLESFAAGEDLDATYARIRAVGAAATMAAETVVIVIDRHDPDHPPILALDPALVAIMSRAEPDSPWEQCWATDEVTIAAGLDELPPRVAAAAEQAGYHACWAYPIPHLGRHRPAAVMAFWRREPGAPEPSATMMADRLVRLTALVIERLDHVRELEHAATHDPLTGLANRTGFFTRVDQLTEVPADEVDPATVGVLYVDLDRFKAVNDGHGHGVGDRVLQVAAERLVRVVRPFDLVARLGGDEFAICTTPADGAAIERIAERVLAALAAPIEVDGRSLRVGATVGLAAAVAGTVTGEQLVDAADRALVAAKAEAKGTWRAATAGRV